MLENVKKKRLKNTPYQSNSQISSTIIKQNFTLKIEVEDFLKEAVKKLSLSARSYTKVLKVSRSIADLEGDDNINQKHIAEALQYRMIEK